jgi:exodeoxyribonuclease VII small subunit
MAKKKTDEPPCFEDALKELDAIARDLEDGALGLDESLQRFEQGIGLLRHCYGVLDSAERKIALLTGFDADGNPITEPFDATATAEQGIAGRRKKRPTRTDVECDDEEAESSSNGGLF